MSRPQQHPKHLTENPYPPKPDTCSECGGELSLVHNEGETGVGEFKERYICLDCRGFGSIEGSAECYPDTWTRTGVVPE